jgi:hypothetical protein
MQVSNVLFITGISVFIMTACTEVQPTDKIEKKSESMPVPLAQNASETPATPALPPMVNHRYAALTDISLNNMGNQITIKPGSTIQATLNYAYHCPSCNESLGNQIIIGLAHRSAQACIYNGGAQGQGSASFALRVPAKPGKYDVRFRVLQAADCDAALKAGWGDDDSPSKETTIGMIIASKKAEI